AGLRAARTARWRHPGHAANAARPHVERRGNPAHRIRPGTGARRLLALAREIAATGLPDPEPRYNLTWMDRVNLENLVLVSPAICAAAEARRDSRGAHFREDFPATSDLAASHYTVSRLANDRIEVETAPVAFTRVRPGETLLAQAAE